MNRYVLLFLSLFISVFVSGCATLLSGSYYSKVDPSFEFHPDDTIVVTTDKEDLDSKFYINATVDLLKNKGFRNVYSNKDSYPSKVKYLVFIGVDRKLDSYQYTGADYGMKDSGQSSTNCYGFGNYANCTTTKNQTYGVTGYSQKTGYIDGHYFSMHWYDMAKKEKVFFAMGSTYEENCDHDKLYQFLIFETIKRLNFSRPMDYKFKVEMPENYTCK